MRWITPMMLVMLLGAMTAAAAGQTDDTHNAATWYRRAIEHIETAALTEQERVTLAGYRAANGAPSPEVLAIIARLEPAFGAIRRGSAQADSDFSLDYDQGMDLLLPHLRSLRDAARLMTAAAEARMASGDDAGAAGAISSLYRLSSHVGRDEVTISALVGAAIFNGADAAVRDAVDRGSVNEAQSMQLLDGLDALAGDDPFGTIDALHREKAMMTDWLGRKYAEQQDRATMLDELTSITAGAVTDPMAAVMLLDEDAFRTTLDEAGHVMDRVVEIFQGDDPDFAQMQLAKLGEEVSRGDYGVIAQLLTPGIERIYELHVETVGRIAERRAQLLAIATGAVSPAALANAAVWYLQAIEAMDEIDAEGWRGIRMLLADTTNPVNPEARRGCIQGAKAIELLMTAASMVRCDFTIARPGLVAVPDYVPPLRNAARLLAADALCLLAMDQPVAATRCLVACDRMGAHLAGDGVITSSLVAHASFAATTELMSTALAKRRLDHRALLILVDGVGSTSRLDPFGHVAARAAARDTLAVWIARAGRPEDLRRQARHAVDNLDIDALLALLIMRDTLDERDLPALWPVGDVLDAGAVAEARAAAGRFRERFAVGDYSVLEATMSPVSRIDDPIKSARPLLQSAFDALDADR